MRTAEKKPPPNAGKGRKKGVPNKLTGTLKQMILEALDERGGVEFLRKLKPDLFVQLLCKVLPAEVKNADGAPFRIEVVEQVVDAGGPANDDPAQPPAE